MYILSMLVSKKTSTIYTQIRKKRICQKRKRRGRRKKKIENTRL